MQLDSKNDLLGKIYVGQPIPESFKKSGIKVAEQDIKQAYISGLEAFDLYQTYGFPIEMIIDLVQEKRLFVDIVGFRKEKEKHQEVSRKGLDKKFKGGLADDKEMTVKLHTAAHLLHEALRRVLGEHVNQAGQNITEERLRFDFTQPKALSKEELIQIEDLVNQQIKKGLAVTSQEMGIDEAMKKGAVALFKDKYPDRVTLYSIGDYSNELCLGPHIKNTKGLGKFKITKEESSSKGVRRIRGILK